MAGIVGTVIGSIVAGNDNPHLSEDLNKNTEALFMNDLYDIRFQLVSVQYGVWKIVPSNRWPLVGVKSQSFKDDYYERIHLSPTTFELGTIANAVTRQVSVWNAYTLQSATLNNILILNGTGVTVTGAALPTAFFPLQERFWTITVTPNGPPQINASVTFDFSDVTDPLPVAILGNRAIVLPVVPEIPVKEKWSWLTDVHVAVNGEEQRAGLRAVPRRELNINLTFLGNDEVREQYRIMLASVGRLFVPYFQYSSRIDADASAGASVLSFNTGLCDLRNDDYVLLTWAGTNLLVQLDVIGASNATTKAPLTTQVPKGAQVSAIYASILPNNLTLNRGTANNNGSLNLSSTAQFPRSSFTRPGSTETLTTLAGYPILTRRPMGNDGVSYAFDTGAEPIDANTGLIDTITDWEFTRTDIGYEFLIRRVGTDECTGRTGVQEFDYWRLFADSMKGSLNTFLMPTYRDDQLMSGIISAGSDSMIFQGPSYADNFWSADPYKFIAITTAKGIHYAQVTGASKNGDGNTTVSFTPALPATAGWEQVEFISYLMKLRIGGDKISLDHYMLDTIFSFSARTVAE